MSDTTWELKNIITKKGHCDEDYKSYGWHNGYNDPENPDGDAMWKTGGFSEELCRKRYEESREPIDVIKTNTGWISLGYLSRNVFYNGMSGRYKTCGVCGVSYHPSGRKGCVVDYKGHRDVWVCKRCLNKLVA